MSATPHILLIDHHDNPGDDLAASGLAALGLPTRLVCPFKGEALPPLDQSIAGAVIYGGLQNAGETVKYPYLKAELDWLERALHAEIPLLGICLGAQLMARQLGATVDSHPGGQCEFGYYEIRPAPAAGDFLTAPLRVPQAHFQQFDLPPAATLLAVGDAFPCQAFRHGRRAYGLQFHPEVTPAIFSRWQQAEWAAAFHRAPGAQARPQQDAHKAAASPAQARWLRGFLASLFGGAAPAA